MSRRVIANVSVSRCKAGGTGKEVGSSEDLRRRMLQERTFWIAPTAVLPSSADDDRIREMKAQHARDEDYVNEKYENCITAVSIKKSHNVSIHPFSHNTSQLTPNQAVKHPIPLRNTKMPIRIPVPTRSPTPRKPPFEGQFGVVVFPKNVQRSTATMLSRTMRTSASRIRDIDQLMIYSNPSGCSILLTSSAFGESGCSSSVGKAGDRAGGGAAASRWAQWTNAYLDFPSAGLR